MTFNLEENCTQFGDVFKPLKIILFQISLLLLNLTDSSDQIEVVSWLGLIGAKIQTAKMEPSGYYTTWSYDVTKPPPLCAL